MTYIGTSYANLSDATTIIIVNESDKAKYDLLEQGAEGNITTAKFRTLKGAREFMEDRLCLDVHIEKRPKDEGKYGTALAKNVREAREKMRMSQSDLSRATGLSRQAIHQLENGLSRCPSACNALLIAKALETSVEELLKSHCKRRVDQYVIQYDYRDYERRMRMEARGAEE